MTEQHEAGHVRQLPFELVDYILSFIDEYSQTRSRTETLRACALVARAWRFPSQHLLFSCFTIWTDEETRSYVQHRAKNSSGYHKIAYQLKLGASDVLDRREATSYLEVVGLAKHVVRLRLETLPVDIELNRLVQIFPNVTDIYIRLPWVKLSWEYHLGIPPILGVFLRLQGIHFEWLALPYQHLLDQFPFSFDHVYDLRSLLGLEGSLQRDILNCLNRTNTKRNSVRKLSFAISWARSGWWKDNMSRRLREFPALEHLDFGLLLPKYLQSAITGPPVPCTCRSPQYYPELIFSYSPIDRST